MFLPTSGLSLNPPVANGLAGTDKPTVAVAIDATGRLFFSNQIVNEGELKSHLRDAAKELREPLTLVIHADKTVTEDQLIHLALLAYHAGITNALLATLPGAAGAPVRP